jgi:hypothetical protein
MRSMKQAVTSSSSDFLDDSRYWESKISIPLSNSDQADGVVQAQLEVHLQFPSHNQSLSSSPTPTISPNHQHHHNARTSCLRVPHLNPYALEHRTASIYCCRRTRCVTPTASQIAACARTEQLPGFTCPPPPTTATWPTRPPPPPRR